ncbi:MAG TPA: lipid-binding SYLF domain-containing protein [Steroidobacteraceae bacterium]|nr:lipid-binding SYLF domain-containing protein [Steroidobacteraceae bacterium]
MMRFATRRFIVPISAAIAAVGLAGAVPALAAQSDSGASSMPGPQSDAARSAQDRVGDAMKLVQQMKQNPSLAAVLARARGIFIIPHYGKGGFIVGGQGGGGVVLAKHATGWSSPAFYSLSGGSIGAQAGGEGGAVAMILMTEKAVSRFENSSSGWSLNGNAGLTVVNWSGKTQANTNRGDVILWSNTKGLYGGLTASVTHISPDTKMDHAYYQRPVTSGEILAGTVTNPNADPLRNALASRVASSQ